MTETPVGKMSFEEAMSALEDVVRQLESGDVPLEQSIALYEHGAKLKEHCAAKLKDAEEKVAQIAKDANGAAVSADPVEIS